MTIAILAGLQANLQATTAVRDELAGLGLDAVYVLGDIVGYGGEPAAVIELVRTAGWRCLGGIWDYAVADPAWDGEPFNPRANCSRWWTRGALSSEQRAWLAALPQELRDDAAGCHFVHASPGPDRIRAAIFTVAEARAALAHTRATQVFCGHTNVPLAFHEEGGEVSMRIGVGGLDCRRGRQLINVGAVGQPRDGDARACFAIYDPVARHLDWRRVAYDIAGATSALRAGGLPAFFADRLAVGR